MLIETLCIAMVLLAAWTDLRARRIPNALIAAGLLASAMANMLVPGAGGWQAWLLGALVGFACLLPFYLMRGMAAGDVKLMAAVGAFLGPLAVFQAVVATFLIGGVWSLWLLMRRGQMRQAAVSLTAMTFQMAMRAGIGAVGRQPAGTNLGRLPYGVAIALGVLTVIGLQRAGWLISA